METTLSIIKITHANVLASFFCCLEKNNWAQCSATGSGAARRTAYKPGRLLQRNLQGTAIKGVGYFFFLLGGVLFPEIVSVYEDLHLSSWHHTSRLIRTWNSILLPSSSFIHANAIYILLYFEYPSSQCQQNTLSVFIKAHKTFLCLREVTS